ncbi:RNA-directed DNA polymerase [Escherichia coli]
MPTVSGSTGSKGVPNNTRGVPQGLAISNILAEISLSDFDNEINKMHDIWYMRYVDDILILTQKDQATKIASHIIDKLQSLNLNPHPLNEENSKSKVGSLDESFNFWATT